MDITTRSYSTIAIIVLNGRFDAYTVPQVKQALDQTSSHDIIVNLSGVHFIDSSGLNVLVSGMKRSLVNKGNLYLCCLQQPVQIIFELTRLWRAFDIFDSEDEAIAAYMKRPVPISSL